MIWVWIVDLADLVIGWVCSWFPDVTITYPDGFTLQVPIPGGLPLSVMGAAFVVGIFVGLALIVGRFLTWLYRLIPMNG